MKLRSVFFFLLFGFVLVGTTQQTPSNAATPTPSPKAGANDPGTVTTGSASSSQQASPTTACIAGSRSRFVEGRSGVVTATDGSQWTVPAEVTEGLTATNLYNDCTLQGDNAAKVESELKTVVIDQDGVEITANIFADNYFELLINGVFVAKDAITFVPFNSAVVRFKVKYPYTIAVKMVDWETHLGIGAEYAETRVGDGGFIAQFSDGTVTNENWKVEPFYIAPLDNPSCVDVVNGRNSSACSVKPACLSNHADVTCQALHFAIPADWIASTYDDSWWNAASLYTAQQVTNQPAYTNYTNYFAKAKFIWSSGLLLDNLVLARYTVQKP